MKRTPEQIEAALTAWRATYEKRDGLVREAHAGGFNINQIHTLTGIGRSTIYRILEKS